jgi:hypothetical protein
MSVTPRILALVFTTLLIPAASAQDITRMPSPTVGPTTTGSGVADPASQAPVGHRQPRASDVPAGRSSADDDAWLNRVNRDVDKHLNICRGC